MSHLPRTSRIEQGPWCQYCQQHRNARRFDKHIESCKIKHQEHLELASRAKDSLDQECTVNLPDPPRKRRKELVNDITQADNDELGLGLSINGCEEPSIVTNEPSIPQLSNLTSTFIQIIYHPHSGLTKPKKIPLDNVAPPLTHQDDHETGVGRTADIKPWAPFHTRADFEYAESAVTGLLSRSIVDAQLHGIHNGWAENTNISFQSYTQMENTLRIARAHYVQFQEGAVSADYLGKTYTFKFKYCDPWKIYSNWIMDKTLAPLICWYPTQKFLCQQNGRIILKERIYDEFSTGNKWWNIQNSLPDNEDIPHCFLPVSLWLDKGNITKRVKKHPIIIRPVFLPRQVRNASGNGGGVLVGYMPIPRDPADPSDRNAPETIQWQCFKREVYHKVAEVIFGSLRSPALFGEAMTCGDKINRIVHPGIPIKSVDGEESCALTATRAALANFPCPKCLVHHDYLHCLLKNFENRTTNTMQQVYKNSIEAPNKTEAERILQSYGLHATENFFWTLEHSDPYLAISYDKLHSDDLGKWGKHIWPLLLNVLAEDGNKGCMARNMRHVCRWAGLKHFLNVTTVEYADGQVFVDILKCILPCITQLLPKNSSLVHGIRAYGRYRTMIGLNCLTQGRLHRLKQYIKDYEKCCEHISNDYGKNFDFIKQHGVSHVVEDIMLKGATDNYDTRVSEGFHQEVQEAYEQTNRKDTDGQMARIDENQEAVAHIRMTIDNYDKTRHEHTKASNLEDEHLLPPHDLNSNEGQPRPNGNHWSLGSPMNLTTSRVMEHYDGLRGFHKYLQRFLAANCDVANAEDPITIRNYQCIYIKYQSMEDWNEGCDILRCNPSFNQEPRFDFVLVNTDTPEPTPARLKKLIRIFTQHSSFDIAVVKVLKLSAGNPRTRWTGARLYDEARDFELVKAEYLVRGVHMINAFDLKEGSFYLNDLIDGDMFLRFGN